MVHAKPGAVDLLPSIERTQAPAAAAKPPDEKDLLISQLLRMVSEQQQVLNELRREQQRQFLSLEEQVLQVRASVVEQQRAALAEMRVEQRILRTYCACLYELHVILPRHFVKCYWPKYFAFEKPVVKGTA